MNTIRRFYVRISISPLTKFSKQTKPILTKWTWCACVFFLPTVFFHPHFTPKGWINWTTNVHWIVNGVCVCVCVSRNKFVDVKPIRCASMKSAWQNVIEAISENTHRQGYFFQHIHTSFETFESETFAAAVVVSFGTREMSAWSMAPKFKQILSQCMGLSSHITRVASDAAATVAFGIPLWMHEWNTI